SSSLFTCLCVRKRCAIASWGEEFIDTRVKDANFVHQIKHGIAGADGACQRVALPQVYHADANLCRFSWATRSPQQITDMLCRHQLALQMLSDYRPAFLDKHQSLP